MELKTKNNDVVDNKEATIIENIQKSKQEIQKLKQGTTHPNAKLITASKSQKTDAGSEALPIQTISLQQSTFQSPKQCSPRSTVERSNITLQSHQKQLTNNVGMNNSPFLSNSHNMQPQPDNQSYIQPLQQTSVDIQTQYFYYTSQRDSHNQQPNSQYEQQYKQLCELQQENQVLKQQQLQSYQIYKQEQDITNHIVLQNKEQTQIIQRQEYAIQEKELKIDGLEKQLENQLQIIYQLNQQTGNIRQYEAENEALKQQLLQLQQQLNLSTTTSNNYENTIAQLSNKNIELQNVIKCKDQQIEDQLSQIQQKEQISQEIQGQQDIHKQIIEKLEVNNSNLEDLSKIYKTQLQEAQSHILQLTTGQESTKSKQKIESNILSTQQLLESNAKEIGEVKNEQLSKSDQNSDNSLKLLSQQLETQLNQEFQEKCQLLKQLQEQKLINMKLQCTKTTDGQIQQIVQIQQVDNSKQYIDEIQQKNIEIDQLKQQILSMVENYEQLQTLVKDLKEQINVQNEFVKTQFTGIEDNQGNEYVEQLKKDKQDLNQKLDDQQKTYSQKQIALEEQINKQLSDLEKLKQTELQYYQLKQETKQKQKKFVEMEEFVNKELQNKQKLSEEVKFLKQQVHDFMEQQKQPEKMNSKSVDQMIRMDSEQSINSGNIQLIDNIDDKIGSENRNDTPQIDGVQQIKNLEEKIKQKQQILTNVEMFQTVMTELNIQRADSISTNFLDHNITKTNSTAYGEKND